MDSFATSLEILVLSVTVVTFGSMTIQICLDSIADLKRSRVIAIPVASASIHQLQPRKALQTFSAPMDTIQKAA